MNNPHSLPDSGTPRTEGGFLFDDWNLTEEKGLTESGILLDGKIIARMPDLGSVSIAQSLEKPKFPSFWGKACASVLSAFQGTPSNVADRERFFYRMTAFGGVILLVGAGILFFDQGKDKQTENVSSVAEILAKNTEITTIEPFAVISETAFSPISQPESGNAMSSIVSNSTIPVAPVESIAAVSPSSPWDRPVADSHLPWAVTPSQPDPFQPIEVAAIDTIPPMPSETVVMSPMTPITATPMPISPPHSMAISPFEMQMIAQSNVPHPPVGPPPHVQHVQPNHPAVPPGMMPMQERLQYIASTAPPQIPHWHPSAQQQQFSPPVHGHVVPTHNPHGQSMQHPQYVIPPGYMLSSNQRAHNQIPPQQMPQSTPIPSGVSTLPAQGGQHMHPHGMPMQHMQPHGTPMQRPPNNFYNPPPPTSRWM